MEGEVAENSALLPDNTKEAAKAIFLLLFYSFLMFSLPFGVFFSVKYILRDTYGVDGFANTAWSVFGAVVTVNVIICAYVYHAYHDAADDDRKQLAAGERVKVD